MNLRVLPSALLLLAACRPAPQSPEQLFKTTVLPMLEAGDEAGYHQALQDLLHKSASFKTNFERSLVHQVPASRLTSEPRLHILSPAGICSFPEWTQADGAILIRWFDERTPPRDPRRLSARLYVAKVTPEVPGSPREKGEFLSENLLLDNTRQPDGTVVTSFTTRYFPAGWLTLELRDPDSVVAPKDKIEDQTWFTYTFATGGYRKIVADARDALAELCRRAQTTPAQSDLLLARLLAGFEFLRPAAQLLELMHQDGRRSAGSAGLLKAVYAALGRGPAVPPEPAGRDDAADFTKPMR